MDHENKKENQKQPEETEDVTKQPTRTTTLVSRALGGIDINVTAPSEGSAPTSPMMSSTGSVDEWLSSVAEASLTEAFEEVYISKGKAPIPRLYPGWRPRSPSQAVSSSGSSTQSLADPAPIPERKRCRALWIRDFDTSWDEYEVAKVFGWDTRLSVVNVDLLRCKANNFQTTGQAIILYSCIREAEDMMRTLNSETPSAERIHVEYSQAPLLLAMDWPEYVEGMEPTTEPVECTVVQHYRKEGAIHVRNLHRNMTDDHIKEILTGTGGQCVGFMRGFDPHTRTSTALVQYSTPEEMEDAISKLNGSMLPGTANELSLTFDSEDWPLPVFVRPVSDIPSIETRLQETNTCAVHINNLAPICDRRRLAIVFSKAGKILDHTIFEDNEYQESISEGQVVFETVAESRKTIEMFHGMSFYGWKVDVSFAEPPKKRLVSVLEALSRPKPA